jgi:hypothetical protein
MGELADIVREALEAGVALVTVGDGDVLTLTASYVPVLSPLRV